MKQVGYRAIVNIWEDRNLIHVFEGDDRVSFLAINEYTFMDKSPHFWRTIYLDSSIVTRLYGDSKNKDNEFYQTQTPHSLKYQARCMGRTKNL